jgi:iron complex outermembrane receptor protein
LNIDASFTTGGNSQTVNQSHNRNFVYVPTYNTTTGEFDATLYTEKQKKFDPGGTGFYHNVGNLDISKI